MDELLTEVVEALGRAGLRRGDTVGLALMPGVGLGVAAPGVAVSAGLVDPAPAIRAVEQMLRPRWALWSNATAATLVEAGVRIATCWDVAAAHRILHGGWHADPALVWAASHGLEIESIPSAGPPDLFNQGGDDQDDPIRPDGYLQPAWVRGDWSLSPARLQRWAQLVSEVASRQHQSLSMLADRPAALALARSESAAELLCAELSADGLPMDRAAAETIIAGFVGPRPRSDAEALERRASRDARVLRHDPAGLAVDLRSPGQVRALLGRVGVDLVDTRAWRLRAHRDMHPLIEDLLEWRKAERVATTYGYSWLDEHLGSDRRLHGRWTGCDGAAGRMTASGGLHNMPAEMRAAVVAEPGHVFVRADLGQIELRVLAAISADPALARASAAEDMYAPVARQLGVDRPTAKVAVLGAMYGQTTGHGAEAFRGLKAAYPTAMAYLDESDRSARAGRDLRTYGGRLISLSSPLGRATAAPEPFGRAAARGRYGRNAMVQGAAAELFKVWAVTVRARAARWHARVVLCLHDELLVHTPAENGQAVAQMLDESLREACRRWSPANSVRFTADTSVITCWSEAKTDADSSEGEARDPTGSLLDESEALDVHEVEDLAGGGVG